MVSRLDSRQGIDTDSPHAPEIASQYYHAPRAAMLSPPDVSEPHKDLNWDEIGLRYIPSLPVIHPDLNLNIAKLRYGSDYQAILVVDGSFQGNKSAPLHKQAGCGFICHLLDRNETWISARHLPKSTGNNSAPVSEAESTLLGLKFLLEKAISRALIIHDNYDMHAFISNKHRSAKKDSRYAKLKEAISAILGQMDAIFCCHVRSHQSTGLAENNTADELASTFMRNSHFSDLQPTLVNSDIPIAQVTIDACHPPSSNVACPTLNFSPVPSLPSLAQCDICGCPSHHASGCFMHRSRPCMSPFTREKPIRTVGFCDSFLHPESIDWDKAPSVMHDHMFIQFLGTMFSLALKMETLFNAYLGLIALSTHYYFSPLRSKMVKKKHKVHHDSVGPCPDEDVTRHKFEAEAQKLHTFARIAHERKWGRAINFVHKTERISPLDPRMADQWAQIHPEPPTPEDELTIPYDPSSFEVFEIDRQSLSKKIDSWDITKAAGLNGFSPSILIHFNNLTAKTEDSENPNPYFTSFVMFIQLLASGKMAQMREVALNYKGAFLNKLPAGVGFKVRNLGMADVFHRLASYSILLRSIPQALDAGFLTEFDLGSGRMGGIDKFVKIAQALANDDDTVILSSDLEKAYNSVLRSDTWEAVQEINFPPLTQWFIYTYGSSPIVNYIIDPRLPISPTNVKKVTLKIGVPQGDNLSGSLFSITLRYVTREFFRGLAARSVKIGFATVLDDTLLAFNLKKNPEVGQYFQEFIATLKSRNLKINVEKSIVFAKSITPALIMQIRKVPSLPLTNQGFDVCKIPVGTPLHISAYISRVYHPKIKIAYESMLHIWAALYYLQNQERFNTFYIFLRLCFASKFVYWLRNLLPSSAQPLSTIIDAKIDLLSAKLYPQLPATLTIRQPFFSEMADISRRIESLPLSMNGTGITRMEPIRYVGHFATCAESFSSVLAFCKELQLGVSQDEETPATSADAVREQLFPSLSFTISRLLDLCSNKMKIADFVLSPNQEYRGVQKSLSTAMHATSHSHIVQVLPLEMYRAWFSSRKDTFASLSLNSSVRHVTYQRPPLDKVFPVVIAMRSMRPIFHNYTCDCGEYVDVCGLHVLRCGRVFPKPFVSLHNKVRDATVRALQNYTRKNAPSALSVFSEVHRFHMCQVQRYYPSAAGCTQHRADAIVVEDSMPFQPWFLDFVQAQIDDFDETKIMRHVEAAYQRKITDLVRDHVGVPRTSVIPIAFSSNCVFHPSSLLFIDFFLCRASAVPVSEPPAIEKLKVLQAMSSAIVDQSAAILTCHFSKFIHALHSSSFPLGLPPVQVPRRFGRRSAHQLISASPVRDDSVESVRSGNDLISCSQSSTSASSASASVPSCRSSGEPPLPLARVSARLQGQGVRRYTVSGGWWTEH